MPEIRVTPQMIEAQINQKDYGTASAYVEEILTIKPDSAKAHFYKGLILYKTGNIKGGYLELQKAQDFEPALKFASSTKDFYALKKEVALKLGDTSIPYVAMVVKEHQQELIAQQQFEHNVSVAGTSIALALIIGGAIMLGYKYRKDFALVWEGFKARRYSKAFRKALAKAREARSKVNAVLDGQRKSLKRIESFADARGYKDLVLIIQTLKLEGFVRWDNMGFCELVKTASNYIALAEPLNLSDEGKKKVDSTIAVLTAEFQRYTKLCRDQQISALSVGGKVVEYKYAGLDITVP